MGRKGRRQYQCPRRSNESSAECSASVLSDTVTSDTNNTGGLYAEYKRATESFKRLLASLIDFRPSTVSDLERAARIVVEKGVEVPKELLHDLSTAIRVREIVKNSFYSKEADEGHVYIVSVLRYCRELLKPLVKRPPKQPNRSPSSVAVADEAAFSSRFAALSVEDEESDEEEEDDDDDIQGEAEPPKRPTRPITVSNDMPIDDLYRGDDFFRAATFLITLDELMRIVDREWVVVKTKWREQRGKNLACFDLLSELTKATVVTNTTIQHVHHLEQVLAMEVPHFKSFYHILTVLIFRRHVRFFVKNVLSGANGESVAHQVLDCVAELMREGFCQMSFANAYDSEVGRKVSDELSRLTGLDIKTVKSKVKMILFHSACEVLAVPEEKVFREQVEQMKVVARSPHSWLSHLKFIGGGRSLLNTHHLTHAEILSFKRGRMFSEFGKLWDERTNPATQIRGDMDQLLVGEILPRLWMNVKRGWLGDHLYLKEQILPLFHLMTAIKKEDNMPIALSFGIHAVLTSIFRVQGQDDVKSITVHSKLAFSNFCEQLEDCYLSDLPWPPPVKTYLASIVLATKEMLKEEGCTILTNSAATRGFWNPCCAGMFVTHASYISLYCGVNAMDTMMQARIALHVYNALRCKGLVRDNLPLISLLDQLFQNAQGIFPGGRPCAGSFATFCGVAMGLRLDSAAANAEMKMKAKTAEEQMLVNFVPSKLRQTASLKPSDFCLSFRILCESNYTGMPQTETTHKSISSSFLHELRDRLRFALTAVEDEKHLLRINFVQVGEILNAFIETLVDAMGWHEQIALLMKLSSNTKQKRGQHQNSFRLSSECKERLKTATLVIDLLAELDRGESVEQSSKAAGRKAADCMEAFFGDPKLNYTFY